MKTPETILRCRIARKTVLFVLPVFLLPGLMGCRDPATRTGWEIDAGVYCGRGVWDESATAVVKAILHAEYTVETIPESALLNDSLHRYGVVVIPGGDPREISTGLGIIGMQRLNHFVRLGGGFVGLGGGAVVVDSDTSDHFRAGIFPGRAAWPIDRIASYPTYTMTDLQLVDRTNPITRNIANRLWSLYRWGPEFLTGDFLMLAVLFRYTLTGTPAVIAFPFGQGRIFLSGCQLENEENSDRDGTQFGNELHDPDSEWNLFIRGLQYCLWEAG